MKLGSNVRSVEYLRLLNEADTKASEYLARRITVERCCKKECLLSRGYPEGVALAEQCLAELRGMDRNEKKAFLMQKVAACITGKTKAGYINFNWTIGTFPGSVMQGVCRKCFCHAYCIGHTYVDVLVAKLKVGEVNVASELNDGRHAPLNAFTKNITDLAACFDIELSPLQLAALVVPNTIASLTCFAWMQSYFEAVGDKQPNHQEIHLEPISIKEVHSEYHQVISDSGEPVIEYTPFISMWHTCFKHVKIREYKAVTGKCKTCTLLSEARRKQQSLAGRRYLTELHALHRTMYMGERLSYYSRRNDAMLMPNYYWSGIGDGMQQAHCNLPHRGNMVAFPQTLPQHLQGMISHGRSIQIFRTFHNVAGTSNLASHALLLALEKVKEVEGRVPDTLYYQIDGGPENTANAVFGLMELIINRGLTKRIIITRLPVGHTHEDIDSKFAVIWKRIRNKFVLTPAQYAKEIELALTTAKMTCNVIDIFIVPDYAAYIIPHLDPNLGRYAKRHKDVDWTQLQFEFIAVPVSEVFPCGSKMTYRKYSQEDVILIEACGVDEGRHGFNVLKGHVTIQPQEVPPDVPQGMYVLRSLPAAGDQLHPEAFVAGSRESLERTVAAIKSQFAFHCPEVVAEWEHFRDVIAPQDDDAERYRRDHGMPIPFAAELFGNEAAGDGEDLAPSVQTVLDARDVTFTASMKWSGRGARKEKVANVPYVVNSDVASPREARPANAEAAIGRGSKRRQDRSPSVASNSSSSSSSDEPEFEYTEFGITDSNARDYVKYIGRIFDDGDDGGAYQILAICDMRKVGGRRSTNIVHAFKYVAIDAHTHDHDAHMFTPVREMLNSYWCKWRPAPQARSSRAATAVAAPAPEDSSSSRRSLRNSSSSTHTK